MKRSENTAIDLQSEIQIIDLMAWMDGGSVTLACKEVSGNVFEIEFHQHMVLAVSHDGKLPGRIYLNGELVEERSGLEDLILTQVDNAKAELNNDLDIAIITEKIDYVRSEQFLINNAAIGRDTADRDL